MPAVENIVDQLRSKTETPDQNPPKVTGGVAGKKFGGPLQKVFFQHIPSLKFGSQVGHQVQRREAHHLSMPESDVPNLVPVTNRQLTGFSTEMDDFKYVIQSEIRQLPDQTHACPASFEYSCFVVYPEYGPVTRWCRKTKTYSRPPLFLNVKRMGQPLKPKASRSLLARYLS